MGRATNFNPNDIIGNRYGKLEVLKYIGKAEREHMYICKCDCGKVIEKTRGNLINGSVKSCGCLRNRTDFNDIIGKKFGMLTVVKYLGKIGQYHRYICKCDCGGQKEISRSNWLSRSVSHCGCLAMEIDPNDIIGKRVGRLTVLNVSRQEGSKYYYLCQCDCGNTVEVLRYSLTNNGTRSCGCLKHDSNRCGLQGRNKKKMDGIKFNKADNKWYSRIRYNGINYDLGCYNTSEEALERRNKAAEEIDKYDKVITYVKACNTIDKTYSISGSKFIRVGVEYVAKNNKWKASILYHLWYFDLGTYETYEKAVAARELAEDEISRYQEVCTYESRRNINEK